MDDADRIQIRIDDLGLEAWITVLEGEPLERSDLDASLASLGIGEGLLPEALERVEQTLTTPQPDPREVCVARGVPAEDGRPPCLVLDEPSGPIPGVRREDGSLDFRDRRILVPVAEGEPIGRIEAAVEGKPGRTVQGEAIEAAPPGELQVRLGDGVVVEEDGRVIAGRVGARSVDSEGAVDVVELHVHPGHVDLTSGHVETKGSLEIARDVTVGMAARAGRDLMVGGTVDGGRAEASGSIEIKGGAIGREQGRIRAGEDLSVRHALGIELFARGRITVARSVSTSELAAREVEVGGRMLSNTIRAEIRIEVQDAGSSAEGPCHLRVACPLDPEGFDPSSRPARVDGRDGGRSRLAHRKAMLRARKGRSQNRSRTRGRVGADTDLALRLDWRRRQRALQQGAEIVVKGTAHPGCRIDFGFGSWLLDEETRATRFHVDPKTGDIVATEI